MGLFFSFLQSTKPLSPLIATALAALPTCSNSPWALLFASRQSTNGFSAHTWLKSCQQAVRRSEMSKLKGKRATDSYCEQGGIVSGHQYPVLGAQCWALHCVWTVQQVDFICLFIYLFSLVSMKYPSVWVNAEINWYNRKGSLQLPHHNPAEFPRGVLRAGSRLVSQWLCCIWFYLTFLLMIWKTK